MHFAELAEKILLCTLSSREVSHIFMADRSRYKVSVLNETKSLFEPEKVFSIVNSCSKMKI